MDKTVGVVSVSLAGMTTLKLRLTRSNGQGALTAKSAPRLALVAGNNGKSARARIASFGPEDS
jgi:hypothetical protein